MTVSECNKRIAKNTLFLYMRMVLIMGVSLYTIRTILGVLGVVDYGIYNVVGGIVTLFSFINGTLATSSQRYFSIELARGDIKTLQKVFCLNVTVFAVIVLGIIFLAETVGLWFLNTQMTIPDDRLFAANIVYQLSILSFAFQMLSVPYNALIVAHEQMSAFAYIGIIEAVLKLAVVFVLTYFYMDKLILYGILLSIVSILIASVYFFYCGKLFVESKYRFYWNRKELMELMSFSGWHFLGTMAVVTRSQGINLLINLFFNPAVNAARAIAFQIDAAVVQLSTNFFTAVKPQMYKLYSKGELNELHKLIFRSTVMSFFLVSVLVFPIITNVSFILHVWLEEVPDYCIIFTQLVLINALINSTSDPTIVPAFATGKIKIYQLVVASLMALNLPVSYFALKWGSTPDITMVISIVLSIIIAVCRAFLLIKMINFPFVQYLILFVKLILFSVILLGALQYISMEESLSRLFLLTVVSIISLVMLYYFIIINKVDRKYIYQFLKSKMVL